MGQLQTLTVDSRVTSQYDVAHVPDQSTRRTIFFAGQWYMAGLLAFVGIDCEWVGLFLIVGRLAWLLPFANSVPTPEKKREDLTVLPRSLQGITLFTS